MELVNGWMPDAKREKMVTTGEQGKQSSHDILFQVFNTYIPTN